MILYTNYIHVSRKNVLRRLDVLIFHRKWLVFTMMKNNDNFTGYFLWSDRKRERDRDREREKEREREALRIRYAITALYNRLVSWWDEGACRINGDELQAMLFFMMQRSTVQCKAVRWYAEQLGGTEHQSDESLMVWSILFRRQIWRLTAGHSRTGQEHMYTTHTECYDGHGCIAWSFISIVLHRIDPVLRRLIVMKLSRLDVFRPVTRLPVDGVR